MFRHEPAQTGHMNRSLRSQLLRRLFPLLSAMFVLSGVAATLGAWRHAQTIYDHELIDGTKALAQQVGQIGGTTSLDLPEAARQILQWDAEDVHWYQVRGENSGLIAGAADVPARPESGVESLRGALIYDGLIAGEKVRVVLVNVDLEIVGERVEVRVAETLRKRTWLIAESLSGVLLPQLAINAITVLVIGYSLRKMLIPISEVALRLQSQTHQSLEPLDDRALPSEIVPITQSVNALMARLKAALQAQHRFIADASHQLRTPLTALKLHVDEAAGEADPVKLKVLIAEIQRAADRAVRLSNQLLSMARAEPDSGLVERRIFDLRAMLSETIEAWVPQSISEGVDLGVDASIETTPDDSLALAGPAPVWVKGDPVLLTEAVNNLIHNAITHGGSGTRITVSIATAGEHRVKVRVDDDGPGIEPEDRIRVLERFQQASAASPERSRPATGSGLGLAIASEIARAHEGSISIEDGATGRGVCVVIELPLAELA